MNDEHSDEDTPALQFARDRDAYAAIRGFVYQVDLTIDRWLTLEDDEFLVLESGEDIDRIRAGIAEADPDNWDALLEQVKRRETSLTLRTAAVRAALANFYEHRRLNPSLRLRFRFTTNATAAREQSSQLPPGVTGIQAWNQVASNADIPRDAALLDGLRQLISGADKPDDVRDESWREWQRFAAESTPSELVAFVRAVAFLTGAPPSESLRAQIEHRLVQGGGVQWPHVAERYDRSPVTIGSAVRTCSARLVPCLSLTACTRMRTVHMCRTGGIP